MLVLATFFPTSDVSPGYMDFIGVALVILNLSLLNKKNLIEFNTNGCQTLPKTFVYNEDYLLINGFCIDISACFGTLGDGEKFWKQTGIEYI